MRFLRRRRGAVKRICRRRFSVGRVPVAACNSRRGRSREDALKRGCCSAGPTHTPGLQLSLVCKVRRAACNYAAAGLFFLFSPLLWPWRSSVQQHKGISTLYLFPACCSVWSHSPRSSEFGRSPTHCSRPMLSHASSSICHYIHEQYKIQRKTEQNRLPHPAPPPCSHRLSTIVLVAPST